MKLSIAQLVSGELLAQLNQSIAIAHRDESDLVVYPAFVFETPADPILEYNDFGVALYVVAMLLHDTRENPIHMLFPYMNHKGNTLFIHGYKDDITIYSYDKIADLCVFDEIVNIKDEQDVNVDPIAHVVLPTEKMFSVEDKSFGCVFDFNSYMLDQRAEEDYAYDTMLYFNTTPLTYREDGGSFKEGTPFDLSDLASRGYAKEFIGVVESCGLYNEYLLKGGSSIVTTEGSLLAQCPFFDAGLLSADLVLDEIGENHDAVVMDPIMYERLDLSSKTSGALAKDTLKGLKLALRNYANRMGADTIVLPLIDTFTSYFIYNLACDVFQDRKIVALAYEEYPYVTLQYDTDRVDDLVYVPVVEGGGNEKIEGMYQACERIARYSDGLALIPECMSDYIQNYQAPLASRYVFAPFSHLLYTDIFRIKDIYEQEIGQGPSLIYDKPGVAKEVKEELDKMALECVSAYMSYDYTEAIDIPSALGRIWDRSDFDAQEVLRELDADIPRMRYFIRAFYRIMDDLLYARFLEEEYEEELDSKYFNQLSPEAQDQLKSYRVRGLSAKDCVAQGIIFRYPMRDSRPIPPLPPSDLPPLSDLEEPVKINAVDGIRFNLEKRPDHEIKIGQLPINKMIEAKHRAQASSDPLDMMSQSIKEQLVKAIADALGQDDEDNPAKYMLDMYKLASLTEDSENGNNLFSQN